MSKQNHDLGNKKRKAVVKAHQTPGHTSPEALAQNLVRRGLASHLILDSKTQAERQR